MAGALATAGLFLNKDGPANREGPAKINAAPGSTVPSGNDIYESYRFFKARNDTQTEANNRFVKGFNTPRTNIVPSDYNQVFAPHVQALENPERTTLPSEEITETIARKRATQREVLEKGRFKASDYKANVAVSRTADIKPVPIGTFERGRGPLSDASGTQVNVYNNASSLLGPYRETNPQNVSGGGLSVTGLQSQKNAWVRANSMTSQQISRVPNSTGVDGYIPSTTGSTGLLSGQFTPSDYKKFGILDPKANPKLQSERGFAPRDAHNVQGAIGSTGLEGFGGVGSNGRLEGFGGVGSNGRLEGFGGLLKGTEGFNPTISGPQINHDPPFHNNMVPFFGAHRTQNTMRPHTARLEMFTGNVPESSQFRMVHKKELARDDLFKPVFGLTHPYGTPNLGNYGRDRYVTSQKKTNQLPTNQIRVGRGLNQKGFDWKPADGFHSKYRPPQYNVDDLRTADNQKLTYRGRLLRGQEEPNGRRGFIGKVYKRNPDRFYINSDARYFTTVNPSIAKPRSDRPENYLVDFERTKRQDTTQSYGGIKGPTKGRDAQMDYTNAYNMHAPLKENYRQIAPANVDARDRAGVSYDYGRAGRFPVYGGDKSVGSGCVEGFGAGLSITGGAGLGPNTDAPVGNEQMWTEEGYWARPQERQTTEEQRGAFRLPLGTKQTEGFQTRPYDRAKTTKQETLPHWARETSGAHTKQNERSTMRPYDRAKTTKQETLPHWARDTSGAHTKQNERATMRPYDRAKTTKQETLPHWAREASGPSATQNKRPRDRIAEENMENTGERELVLRSRRPTKEGVKNANGANAVTISIRDRDLVDQSMRNQSALHGGYNPGNKQWQAIRDKYNQGVQGRTMNKVLSEGIRQPEDYLVSEFRKNPYTKPLSSVAAY